MPVLDLRESRWRYTSTVNAPGFAVDRADLDFHEQAVGLLAAATVFNQASLADSLDVYVTVGEQRVLLFSGLVKEWGVGEEAEGGTSASISAEDERGYLLDKRVPAGFCLRGNDYNSMGEGSAQGTLHSALRQIARLAGIEIDPGDAPNYQLGQDIAADAEMTLGAVLARLLRPLQQVRRGRWDLIRLGPRAFRVSQRPLTLGGGYVLPRSAVKLRRYRRSYIPPVASAQVVGAVVHAAAESAMPGYAFELACDGENPCEGASAPPAAPPVRPGPVTECTMFSSQGPGGLLSSIGMTCVTRVGDRTMSTVTSQTNYTYEPDALTPIDQQEHRTEEFFYDGVGRLVRTVTVRQLSPQPPFDGTETVSRTTKTIAYDSEGRVRHEGMMIEERLSVHPVTGDTLDPPQLMITRGESITKLPAGPGSTYKSMDRWRIGSDDDGNAAQIADPPVRELSMGESRPSMSPSGRQWPVAVMSDAAQGCRQGRWRYSDPLIGDAATARLLADLARAQGNKWLVEIEVGMPLDPTLMPGRVVTMTGALLVDVASFYVTDVTVEDSGTARMIVRGEVFLDGPPDQSLGGDLNPRAGFPLPGDFVSRSSEMTQEIPRFQSGIVTAANDDGSAQVYVVEDGVVYPRVWMRSGRPVLARDRIMIERRGVLMWGHG